jgi:hypothetical protein
MAVLTLCFFWVKYHRKASYQMPFVEVAPLKKSQPRNVRIRD